MAQVEPFVDASGVNPLMLAGSSCGCREGGRVCYMGSVFTVLVADDDPNDRMLIQLAVKRSEIPMDTREVHDGEQVIQYLRGEGDYGDRNRNPFPDLLLVDLKMPRMDGLGVLEWIRTHPDCSFLPTIMLSGSGLEEDVSEAHRRGVKAYFVKPGNFNELQQLVCTIAKHWAKARQPKMPERCA